MTQTPFGAAFRNIRRAPAFTGLVVVTLALGIGATTAMFSVVDAVLINPLPFPNSERFGEIWTVPDKGSRRPGGSTALLNALARQPDLFTAIGAWQFGSANLTGSGEPVLVGAPQLSPGLLAILGVQPSLGRWFTDDEAASGLVVLLSDRIWRSRFGADRGIVGQTITLDDRPHLVVGVMPNRFRYPTGTALMWRPLNTASTAKPAPAQLLTVRRPELTRAQVNDRLQAFTQELRASAVIRPADSISTDDPLQARPGAQTGTALYMLFGAVGLVLLVACVNVMNLLLVRGSARSGELALMSALGASRGSLIRGVFFENLILVVAGCVTGIAFARALLTMILAAAPRQMMFLGNATSELDARALGFAIMLAAATGMIFGVLPAWRTARIDAIDALKQRAHNLAGSRDEWWQGALVAAQLALVVVLLAGSGLLMRSFGKLLAVDHGFDVNQLAAVDVQLPRNRYGAPGAGLAFMQELERNIEAADLRASITGGSPPTGGGLWFDIAPEIDDGRTIALGAELPYSAVGDDYFSVMGIPLVEGRSFSRDDPADVVVINTVLAGRFFGDSSAIGRRFRISERQPWMTVVGVAADVKQAGPAESRDEGMEFYQPFHAATQNSYFSLVIRAHGQHASVLQLVKQKLWELDPKLPIVSASTMPDRIGESIARPRFYVTLSSAFALTGAVLGAIGVYGVSAYWVTRRRRELAIRMALGASANAVMRMVVTRSLQLAAIGAVTGMALAAGGTRLIESMLFETGGRDPLTLSGVTFALAALVVIGCLAPAVRAARVDPMTTLRAE